MKLRSVVVVMSAAVMGATAPGFAQAADGSRHVPSATQIRHDANRDARRDREDRRASNVNGVAIALGIGLLGLALASQHDDPPYAYTERYPHHGYGHDYRGRHDGSAYANRGHSNYFNPHLGRVEINPMTGY
jgi:hypothetical protein